MGCCVPKDQEDTETHTTLPGNSPEEENAIRLQEEGLLYGQHKAELLWEEIHKVTEQGKVTPSNFFSFAGHFGLNMKGIDEEQTPIKTFYRKFRDGNRFDAGKLKVLMVLLGQGDPGSKAALLFNTFHSNNFMSLEEIQTMLDAILSISADFLPLLAVHPSGLTEKSYIQLSLSLGSQKDPVRDRMCNLILELRRQVSKEQLIARFQQDEVLQRLCSPRKVRRLLENEGMSLMPPTAR
jgi:hypothetical protein